MTAILDTAVFEEMSTRFSGQLLRAGDTGYDGARRIHNGMIDRRPALIARCLGVKDIVEAVTFARNAELDVAVRGGGHNVAGNAVCDGGVMIDLSLMKGVYVDAKRRTARAQGGVTWGEFNRETQVHALATTGGAVSTTGIAGLTLGGGFGWLMGKYGLTVDNLHSVELVTADGDVLNANAEEDPDLFWALRGGGGNFGVAASLEYRLHSVGPIVVSGSAVHSIDRAIEVLRFYREFTANLPDELVVYASLAPAPDGSGTPTAVITLCHCGSAPEAEAAVRPVKAFGKPLSDDIGPRSYEDTSTMLDEGYPKGALNYWKSSFLSELSDGAIDTMARQFAACPSAMGELYMEHLHGAATRVGETETAFPHRSDGYNLLVLAQWMDPAESPANIAWARETYAAMQPYMANGRNVNYLGGEEEGEDPVAAAYGPNYARLRAVKAKYDPANLFRMNQNIKPA